MINQQGDVFIFQTNDNGEINIEDGITEMSGGTYQAVYLSLFGGNDDDDGSQGNKKSWWGNIDEVDTAFQYRSETQYLLKALPATANNLKKLDAAVLRDTAWMIEKGVATEIASVSTIPNLNSVRIEINVIADGREESFIFEENWKADI